MAASTRETRVDIDAAMAALRADLLAGGEPRISTMSHHQLAIVVYGPGDEFKLQERVRRLAEELTSNDCGVLRVSLQRLLLDRLRAMGRARLASAIEREKRLQARDAERARGYLADLIAEHLEGPTGIAFDILRITAEFAKAQTRGSSRAVILIDRLGALSPWLCPSALLKQIECRPRRAPVVLFCPGKRSDASSLSFMGTRPSEVVRPRVYP